MTRPRLKEEDIRWLEQQLDRAFEPVSPPQEFVQRARLEIMRQPLPRAPLSRQQVAALAGVAVALLGLIGALLYLVRRRA